MLLLLLLLFPILFGWMTRNYLNLALILNNILIRGSEILLLSECRSITSNHSCPSLYTTLCCGGGFCELMPLLLPTEGVGVFFGKKWNFLGPVGKTAVCLKLNKGEIITKYPIYLCIHSSSSAYLCCGFLTHSWCNALLWKRNIVE